MSTGPARRRPWTLCASGPSPTRMSCAPSPAAGATTGAGLGGKLVPRAEFALNGTAPPLGSGLSRRHPAQPPRDGFDPAARGLCRGRRGGGGPSPPCGAPWRSPRLPRLILIAAISRRRRRRSTSGRRLRRAGECGAGAAQVQNTQSPALRTGALGGARLGCVGRHPRLGCLGWEPLENLASCEETRYRHLRAGRRPPAPSLVPARQRPRRRRRCPGCRLRRRPQPPRSPMLTSVSATRAKIMIIAALDWRKRRT